MVNAFEMQFGAEHELVNRRAGGAYFLFTLAELKETVAGGSITDAATGQRVQLLSALPAFVPGHIRQPKKGPAVVQKVRQTASETLNNLISRPSAKWTWGIDVEVSDLK